MSPNFRLAQREDIAQVLVNETSAYVMPWGKQALIDSLQSQYVFWVIEVDNKVIGHLIVQPILDECHLLNICLLPRFQGKGIGKKALEFWFHYCLQQQLSQLLLEVRASNHKAQSLYSKLGFNTIGLRKNYYPLPNQQREDGIVMSCVLESEP